MVLASDGSFSRLRPLSQHRCAAVSHGYIPLTGGSGQRVGLSSPGLCSASVVCAVPAAQHEPRTRVGSLTEGNMSLLQLSLAQDPPTSSGSMTPLTRSSECLHPVMSCRST